MVFLIAGVVKINNCVDCSGFVKQVFAKIIFIYQELLLTNIFILKKFSMITEKLPI
jgi:hypothetical protein